MRVLIADDEPLARLRLLTLLEDDGEHEVVGEAANGRETIDVAQACNPDLVLLDIRMPGMDGLEAARHLSASERPPAIIFTTAFKEHALRAFEAGAVDYLLKPVRQERLVQALARAAAPTRAQLAKLAEVSDESEARTCVSASVNGRLELLPVADIRFFRADSKYVVARSGEGELLLNDSLSTLEEEFAARFIRVHRNALAARRWLRGIERSADAPASVTFNGIDDRLEVSRRLLPAVRAALRE